MRILLYGGTFNPPHRGHVEALSAAVEYLRPDKTLVIPAGIPPHKALADGSPSGEERLLLSRLAFGDIPGAEVTDLELRRDGPSYTVETLREIRRREPEGDIFFLVGTDMLLYMEKWFRFREIFALCTLAALPRNEGELPALEETVRRFQETYDEDVLLIPKIPLPMDSTSLRSELPGRKGRERLPDAVYAEIVRRRLYGARPELAWLREQVKPWMKPSRLAHVLGCEQEAVRLARLWGEDEGDAAEAAILHDITKREDDPGQLRLCEKYGIMTDAFERRSPSLLHARTGAYLARDLFGVPDRIFDAIAWHNTGRVGMSLLEKILWLADFTEPTRDFPGVDRVRALTGIDLDAAMTEALEMTLAFIRERDREIHPRTEETLSWLKAKES